MSEAKASKTMIFGFSNCKFTSNEHKPQIFDFLFVQGYFRASELGKQGRRIRRPRPSSPAEPDREDQYSQEPDAEFEFGDLVNALCMWPSMGLARACFDVSSCFHRIGKFIGYFYLQVIYRLCRFDRMNNFIG